MRPPQDEEAQYLCLALRGFYEARAPEEAGTVSLGL
jgi:hypothetical protein